MKQPFLKDDPASTNSNDGHHERISVVAKNDGVVVVVGESRDIEERSRSICCAVDNTGYALKHSSET